MDGGRHQSPRTVRLALVVALVVGGSVVGCGVEAGDQPAPVTTNPPEGSTAANPDAPLPEPTAPTSTTLPPTTTPKLPADARDLPARNWVLVTLCSAFGSLTLEMPGPPVFEGPRSLLRIPEPATGTFAMSHSDDRLLRYDALVINDPENPAPTAEGKLLQVVTQIDADPDRVVVDDIEEVRDHVEADFRGSESGRELQGRGYAQGGVVLVLDIGTYPGASPELIDLGLEDLRRMESSLVFRGLDDAKLRTCPSSYASQPIGD